MNLKYIADIHIHPTLKPYPNQENIWKFLPENTEQCEKLSGSIRNGLNELSKSSQANLKKVSSGDFRLIFSSLYPIERDFFKVRRNHIALKLFLKKRHFRPLACCVSGLPFDKVDAIFDRIEERRGIHYFEEELKKEYEYLVDQSENSSDKNKNFKLVGNFNEFKEIRGQEPDTIAMVLTIEGAHALGDYSKDRFFTVPYEELTAGEKEHLKASFDENIDTLKQWNGGSHTPLFITFCHHFWNQLAGHAKSFSNRPSLSLIPGMDRLFDQKTGLDQGITELGRFVIDKLLDTSNGRRILIDVKHMSVRARMEYYKYLEDRDENIPLICSHAACNGWWRFKDALDRKDNYRLNSGAYFSRWSINLTDDDIRAFRKFGGLIGIVLHEGRVPGGRTKRLFNKLKKAGRWSTLRKEYVRLVLSNMFQIAKVTGDKSAWEMICLGSDFDGLIDPFNTYDDTTKMELLLSEMRQYLLFDDESYDLVGYENSREIRLGRTEMDIYKYGLSVDEIIENIAWKNAERFIKNHL